MPSLSARLRVRLGAAVLAAAPFLFLLLAAPSAQAHDVLVSTSPADGSTVVKPPDVVELTFNNAVQNQFVQVAVLDQAETPYQDGDPEVLGSTVTQRIRDLPTGTFTVSYRVVSSDGHPISGTSTFTVAGPDDPSANSTASEHPVDDAPVSASTPASVADEADGAPGAGTIVAMIAGAAAAGALIALLVHRRRTDMEDTGSG